MQRLIVVLGMHRSGTSALTRGLTVLGVGLGDDLSPAAPDNPRGFWEEPAVIQLSDDVLASNGVRWDSFWPEWSGAGAADVDPFRARLGEVMRRGLARSALYGVKDPRLCRLLPVWQTVAGELGLDVGYVLAVRNPLSIAHSLEARDGLATEKSLYLWLEHTVAAMLATEGKRRVFVEYERLLEDPARELRRVARTLALPPPDAVELARYTSEFVDEGLCHARFTDGDLSDDRRVPAPVRLAYQLQQRLARDELASDTLEARRLMERLADELAALQPALAYLSRLEQELRDARDAVGRRDARLRAAEEQIAARERRNRGLAQAVRERDERIGALATAMRELEAAIRVVVGSRSWRMTAPLRALNRYVARRQSR